MTNEDSPAPLINPEILVVFADQVEYHRFVEARRLYSSYPHRPPASLVLSPQWCDLKGDPGVEELLRTKSLTNRSVWVRSPQGGISQAPFRLAVRGIKDKGGILFDEIYKSELQQRAERLHKAFLALGLKSWKIEVEEESTDDHETKRKVHGEASVSWGAGSKSTKGPTASSPDCAKAAKEIGDSPTDKANPPKPERTTSSGVTIGGSGDYERYLKETFVQTLKQTLRVEYNESYRAGMDIHTAQETIDSLGLSDDSVILSVLEARRSGRRLMSGTRDMDFKFSGNLRDNFDLAFDISTTTCFNFSARAAGKFESLKTTILNLTKTCKIYVED